MQKMHHCDQLLPLKRPRPHETTLSLLKKKPKTDVRDEILMHMNDSDTTDDHEVDKERKKNMKTKKSKDKKKKKKNNKKAINIKKLSAFQLSKQNSVTYAKFMQKTIPELIKVWGVDSSSTSSSSSDDQ